MVKGTLMKAIHHIAVAAALLASVLLFGRNTRGRSPLAWKAHFVGWPTVIRRIFR